MVQIDSVGFDARHLPSPKEYKKLSPTANFFKNIAVIMFFSSFVFFVVNLPAYFVISGYRINPHKFAKEAPDMQSAVVVASSQGGGVSDSTQGPNPNQPSSSPTASSQKTPVASKGVKQYVDNTLFIPKIGVEAPIGWDIGENDIMGALEKNLAHINGTGKPSEGKNIFVTGHSSNYWWKSGDFKTVFALLPELKENDEIFITYKGKFYKYIVTKSEEVNKDEVSNFIDSDKEQLTLMTCVPVGTNLHRLLVFAKPAQ
jgi:LPXTG-site transpeptidase (sortase) family protein